MTATKGNAEVPNFLRVSAQVYVDTLALIGGVPLQGARRNESDSKALVEKILECWRILPLFPESQIDGQFKDILVKEDHSLLKRCWLAVTAFSKAQLLGIQRFCETLERERVDYSLLKGAATALCLYPEPYCRTSWDVDVGVAKRDLRRAEQLAWDIGFRPAQKNEELKRFERADARLRAKVEAQHYELGFLVRRLQVSGLSEEMLQAIRAEPWAQKYWLDINSPDPWCYAIVDIHHALSHDIGLDGLLSSARVARAGVWSARIPSYAWLGAHLIYKLYWEGVHNYGKGLYQYADVVRLVPFLDTATFRTLINILEEHNMVAAGHYVFRRLPSFGVTLPAHVVNFLDTTYVPPAGSDPVRLNDLGDMWARLWGQR